MRLSRDMGEISVMVVVLVLKRLGKSEKLYRKLVGKKRPKFNCIKKNLICKVVLEGLVEEEQKRIRTIEDYDCTYI